VRRDANLQTNVELWFAQMKVALPSSQNLLCSLLCGGNVATTRPNLAIKSKLPTWRNCCFERCAIWLCSKRGDARALSNGSLAWKNGRFFRRVSFTISILSSTDCIVDPRFYPRQAERMHIGNPRQAQYIGQRRRTRLDIALF
jgi:hypothetical protein